MGSCFVGLRRIPDIASEFFVTPGHDETGAANMHDEKNSFSVSHAETNATDVHDRFGEDSFIVMPMS